MPPDAISAEEPLKPSQTHYALIKLDETARSITQIIDELPILRAKLAKAASVKPRAREVYDDMRKLHAKLIDSLSASRLFLLEMEQDRLAEYAGKLNASVKAFNLMTPDFSRFCGAVKDYVLKLPTTGKTTNSAVIGRLMNNVRMGYYPTDLTHVKMITRGIEFPEGVTTNVFDPCCGCGLALRTLADGNNCFAYGVELDRFRAEEAQGRLHRVGFGSYFHSRISHEAFHLMLLNPPYLSVITEGGQNARSEKRFLVDSMCHLTYGGLLVYIIPYYRLTPDISRVLCDNFEDLTVWRFMDSEFKKFKQIAVMGIRRKRADGSEMVQNLAASVLEPDNLPVLMDLPKYRYKLPSKPIKVETFKGAEFNVAELAEQLKRSKSFSRLFEKSKLDGADKRPLLPLNIGQVGLIGGSGLINGMVECDAPHVIKGRIVKEIRRAEEDKTDNRGAVISTTVTETVVNKMVFNILTPAGFKSLS